MSKATKKKYVRHDWLSKERTFTLPEESWVIVKHKEAVGRNLHMICEPNGTEYLVSMPGKFIDILFLRKNQFMIISKLDGDKVKGEIIQLVDDKYRSYLEKEGAWPKEFINIEPETSSTKANDDELESNTNRRNRYVEDSTDSE